MRNNNPISLFVLMLMLLICPGAKAQKYVVYSVVGKAYVDQAGKQRPLAARQYVTPNSKLKITSESAVTILDEAKLSMFSFTKVGEHRVKDLLNSVDKRTKSLTKQYMGYLVKQLFTSANKMMKHPDAYMQVTGTSYRAVSTDSLMMARLVDILNEGTNSHGSSEEQMFARNNNLISDYAVAMDIIDVQTGLPLKDEVKPNTACYVRVKNDTEEMLYVNVLNIDKAGNKYMVLPMDEEATCANLLIPARSTVSFKTEPFITSDVPSDDAFVMVATEHPVNFSILMEPLKRCSMPIKDVKVGVTRRFIQTR